MPRKPTKLITHMFIRQPDNAFADQVVGKLVDTLHAVNARENEKMIQSKIFERLHAFLTLRNVQVIHQGSGYVGMMTTSSDHDFVLMFQNDDKEDVIRILHETAAHMNASISPHMKKPGNLVTMHIDGKSCDLLCVSEMVIYERIESLNSYVADINDVYDFHHIPISVRPSAVDIPFVPNSLACLQNMSYIIKNSQPSYAAFLLLKALAPKLSTAAITCLTILSHDKAPSVHAVLHHMFINMKAIAELQQVRQFHSTATNASLQRMSETHVDDGCIFVLTPFQLFQIAEVLPVFTQFLKAMSLIDDFGTICIIGEANPASDKFRMMCIELTDMLQDPNVDFKTKSYEIVSRF